MQLKDREGNKCQLKLQNLKNIRTQLVEIESIFPTTSFKAIGEGRRLVPEVEVMLFRIAQEAATNIRRHAQASMAELVIEFCDSKVRLSVKDNGNGFNVPQNTEDLASTGKLGLVGMHERTKLLDGKLTLESRLGKGTIVTIEIPV